MTDNMESPEEIEWEPYPFLYKVCDTVGENCTVELDYLPDGVDSNTSDEVLEGAYCAISTSSVEEAIAMVRDDERARLWQRADSPEVVEAVFFDGHVHAEGGGVIRVNTPAMIRSVLTALIGPRPTEQENANER